LNQITLDDERNPNEPSVCFNASNDSILYAASNIDNFYSYNLKYSLQQSQKATSKYGVYGDPVLHWSGSDLFFAHLAKTEGKKYAEWFDRIVVQRISNADAWQEQSFSVGFNAGKMQDKPWLSSDEFSAKKGSVYVTWTEFDRYGSDDPNDFSRIRFSSLTKGEEAFSDAVTVSDTVGDCLDGDHTLEGATTAVDSLGNIYAVWAGHTNIYFDKSTDGGITWGKDQVIAKQVNGWDMDMPNIMRANGMPFLAIDVARDILYMTWADERNGNADIWLKYSKDKGESWSSAIQLNLDTTSSHQYFPNIAVDQHSGKVYVAYYDFKSSTTQSFYVLSLASYAAGGEVTNVQLTPYVIALPGKKMFYGDYLDIDIHNDKLAVVYTAYDLSQRTEVNLITEEVISDGIFSTIAINNTPAIIRNGDSAQVLLHVTHPHQSTIKVWVRSDEKRKKYIFKGEYDGNKREWDQWLGSLFLGDEYQIYKISYRIKDTEVRNVYKRRIRL
jgi:hypothetical protein